MPRFTGSCRGLSERPTRNGSNLSRRCRFIPFITSIFVPRRRNWSERRSAAHHIAVRCTDLPAALARLREHGVEHTVESVPLLNEEQVFLRDPSGVGVELNSLKRAPFEDVPFRQAGGIPEAPLCIRVTEKDGRCELSSRQGGESYFLPDCGGAGAWGCCGCCADCGGCVCCCCWRSACAACSCCNRCSSCNLSVSSTRCFSLWSAASRACRARYVKAASGE